MTDAVMAPERRPRRFVGFCTLVRFRDLRGAAQPDFPRRAVHDLGPRPVDLAIRAGRTGSRRGVGDHVDVNTGWAPTISVARRSVA